MKSVVDLFSGLELRSECTPCGAGDLTRVVGKHLDSCTILYRYSFGFGNGWIYLYKLLAFFFLNPTYILNFSFVILSHA